MSTRAGEPKGSFEKERRRACGSLAAWISRHKHMVWPKPDKPQPCVPVTWLEREQFE